MKKTVVSLALFYAIQILFFSFLWAYSLRPVIELDHPKIALNKKAVVYIQVGFQGVDEVVKNLDLKKLNRVILLSDRLANQGITRPSKITKLVKKAKNKGVQISTKGLGADYNEDLMQAIAEHANGNYYFIESPTPNFFLLDIFLS